MSPAFPFCQEVSSLSFEQGALPPRSSSAARVTSSRFVECSFRIAEKFPRGNETEDKIGLSQATMFRRRRRERQQQKIDPRRIFSSSPGRNWIPPCSSRSSHTPSPNPLSVCVPRSTAHSGGRPTTPSHAELQPKLFANQAQFSQYSGSK